MQIKCEYCGSMIDDTLEKCPNCGAANANIHRTANKTPKTIEELAEWYAAHNLPPYETTRFFIGIDYKKPKAFGIYKDGDEVVVYKNKADGQRAVRYRGTDEAYGVNEIYLKLKSEIVNQKERNAALREGTSRKRSPKSVFGNVARNIGVAIYAFFTVGIFGINTIAGLLVAGVAVGLFFLNYTRHPLYDKLRRFVLPILIVTLIVGSAFTVSYEKARYYDFNGLNICKYHNNYYYYDTVTYDYYPLDDSSYAKEFMEDPESYRTTWDDSIMDFKESDYYSENFDTSNSSSDSGWSSWDSDSDWDSSDSWDSGSTDWDSDW
jgi:hypothetical protein